MFRFVVRYLSFFKRIPLLPHLFDSWIKIWIFVTNPKLFKIIDDLETEVAEWDSATIHLHKYGGTQFDVNGKEIGHIHSHGLLDILFDKKTKELILAEGRATHHHVFEKSGWISFYVMTNRDKKYALELLKMAYDRSVQRI